MFSPEQNRTSQTNPVSTESQLRQELHALHRRGELSHQELRCLGQFSELFNPSGNPLQLPVGRTAFETSLNFMSDLDGELVGPFIEKLLTAGLLVKSETAAGDAALKVPDAVLEHAGRIVGELTSES